jgi:hypothetical protein
MRQAESRLPSRRDLHTHMTKPSADTTMNYVFSINVCSDIFTTRLRVFDLADRPVLLRHLSLSLLVSRDIDRPLDTTAVTYKGTPALSLTL